MHRHIQGSAQRFSNSDKMLVKNHKRLCPILTLTRTHVPFPRYMKPSSASYAAIFFHHVSLLLERVFHTWKLNIDTKICRQKYWGILDTIPITITCFFSEMVKKPKSISLQTLCGGHGSMILGCFLTNVMVGCFHRFWHKVKGPLSIFMFETISLAYSVLLLEIIILLFPRPLTP